MKFDRVDSWEPKQLRIANRHRYVILYYSGSSTDGTGERYGGSKKFRSTRMARKYVKQYLRGSLMVEVWYTPPRPLEYIQLDFKVLSALEATTKETA